MVLVDASIWKAAMAGGSQSFLYKIKLEALLSRFMVTLTEPIQFEILQSVSNETRSLCFEHLSTLPLVPVKTSTWSIATTIAWDLKKESVILDQSRALTVALALQNKLPLYTIDEAQIAVKSFRQLTLIE